VNQARKSPRRPRKPRGFLDDFATIEWHDVIKMNMISIMGVGTNISPNKIRKLAAWLIRAADWLEAQEKRK